MPKKILLLANHNNGYNITEYLLSRADAEIVKIVVYDENDSQWWNSVKKLAIEKKLDYIVFQNAEDLYEHVKDLDIDFLISANFRHLIPAKILELPKIGAVNFHNSILPAYRGAYANTWPIAQGETKTGVSLHWMTATFDTGDIIAQEEIEIMPWETAKELWEKINVSFLEMFKKAWPQHENWKKISFAQKGEGSYYSIVDYKKTNEIDMDKKTTPTELINFLRAKSFLPHYQNAFFIDKKTKKKIYISVVLSPE